MRLLIIGGTSRLGRALARACPSATSMVRCNADGDAVVSVSGYHAARVSDFVGFDAVVNCAGLVKGEVEALHDATVKSPGQLAARAFEAGVRHFVPVSSFAIHGRAGLFNDNTPIEPNGHSWDARSAGGGALICELTRRAGVRGKGE